MCTVNYHSSGVVYWLVQLPSLTMVVSSNLWWQGSKIRQCRLEGGALNMILLGNVHKKTISLFHSKD